MTIKELLIEYEHSLSLIENRILQLKPLLDIYMSSYNLKELYYTRKKIKIYEDMKLELLMTIKQLKNYIKEKDDEQDNI